jgi:hypothetical protein
MDESTCWSAARHANRFPSWAGERAWLILAVNWPLSICEFLSVAVLNGSFGKMCRASSHPTRAGILAPSSGKWGNAVIASPAECWTLDTSESPSVGVVSSLWDILVASGDVPERCYLTDHAIWRIKERLAKYGKSLPPGKEGSVWGWTGDETPKFAEDYSPTLRAPNGGEGAGVWFPGDGDDSPSSNGSG